MVWGAGREEKRCQKGLPFPWGHVQGSTNIKQIIGIERSAIEDNHNHSTQTLPCKNSVST